MFKRYKPFFKAGSISFLTYRFQVLIWLFINVLSILCVIFLWLAIFNSSPDEVINGFTLKEMIAYLIFSTIFSFVTFNGDTLWIINDDIKMGTIDLSFTKPISYRGRLMFQTAGTFVTGNLIVGLPLMTIAYVVLSLIGYIEFISVWSLIGHVVLFLVAQFIACLLQDTINYLCGILCFYTSSGWGINQAAGVIVRFLSGALLPLSFFPGWSKEVVSYLPFAGMAYNPILIILNKVDILTSIHFVGFSLSWLILLNILASLLFNHASKKITVQGG